MKNNYFFYFQAQQKQCEEILNSEVGEVFLHCLGNAITRGINLGLTLQNNSNDLYGLEANTNTVELVGKSKLVQPLLD